MDKEKEAIQRLFDRYLKGQCSAEEKQRIDRWFDERGGIGNALSKEDLQRLEAEMFTHIREVLPQESANRPLVRKLGKWLRVAAAFLGLCGAGYLFFFYQGDRNRSMEDSGERFFMFQTKAGQRAKLVLPDSSSIWLNSNSLVRYEKTFNDSSRTVFLESGEAFFEVKQEPERPFIVHAGSLDTRVLGTSFNIEVKNHRNHYQLTVNTGKVSISRENEDIPVTVLAAGQQFTYRYASGFYDVKAIDPNDWNAWTKNELLFKNASWEDIAARLRAWYGVEIRLLLKEKHSETFTAKFDNPSLEAVLKSLQKINQFRYTINKKEVVITN